MEAFVYCWTDMKLNKLYVGVHKGKPNDGYVCSSKLMKEEYNKRPQDFKRQIVAQGTFVDCYSLETTILKVSGADKDPGFYNMHNNNGEFYCKGYTEDRNKKISASLKGKRRPQFSDEWRTHISIGGQNSPQLQAHYAFMRTPEGRIKNSLAQRNSIRHKESRKKLKGISQGPCFIKKKPKSQETKNKMRQARLKYWKNKKLVKNAN